MDLSAHEITPIDTRMGGLDQVTSAYLVGGPVPTLVETGPATSAGVVIAALHALNVDPNDLAHIVFTHIHLDHAGGGGDVAQAFPKARVWIHEGVAKHLVDPIRLIASASRIYGEEGLRSLFGHPLPVPADRISALGDGQELDLGDRRLRALHTPGHAATHMALQDLSTDMVFSGDAVGVHLPGPDLFRPAAPPPEFQLDDALSSIGRIERHARGSILFAHFGPTDDVIETCASAIDVLKRWSEIANTHSEAGEDATAIADALEVAEDLAPTDFDPSDRRRLELMGSYRLNALGMERYFRKQREAESGS